ncbi:hypothetical protein [Botrimarina mediterranea]|uniref:hypothetical protein n=1 Tax=Botrimarina mediterranea TaxID=2528022 RepID=UPI00118CA21A|nr:hypothetical protein K2D_36550 [Planctomycetes bacterium K2D]
MQHLDFGFESPLSESLVLRDGIATFESQFETGIPSDVESLCAVLRSLDGLTCYGGASDFPLHPMLIELRDGSRLRTGREALAALMPRHFESEHVVSLDADYIPYPGYRPGTKNDEIHSDPTEQYIFANELDGENDPQRSMTLHAKLRNVAEEGRLWYVLLHTAPTRLSDGFEFREFVYLVAIGKAPGKPIAFGVVTTQVCHNLCD